MTTTHDDTSSTSWRPQRRVAQTRFELDLQALIELTETITSSANPYFVAETSLLCLMGMMGAPRGALWAIDDGEDVVRLRNYGFAEATLNEVEDVNEVLRWDRSCPRGILFIDEIETRELLGEARVRRFEADRVEVILVLRARTDATAILVLGGESLSSRDRYREDLLETAARYAAATLEASRLHARLFESNRRLDELSKRVDASERHKEEFLANITHELRTPLSVVAGGIDLALNFGDLDDEMHEILTQSNDATQDLDEMIMRILEYRQAEDQTLQLLPETIDLVDFARLFTDELRPGVNGELREMAVSSELEELPTTADPRWLHRVLLALLDNAQKFTPRGSTIVVGVGRVTHDGHERPAIWIADDGPGIPSEELNKLQEVFRQLDGTTTRRVGGMGLGLAYVRILVREMGGDFRITSTWGVGTTCHVIFGTRKETA